MVARLDPSQPKCLTHNLISLDLQSMKHLSKLLLFILLSIPLFSMGQLAEPPKAEYDAYAYFRKNFTYPPDPQNIVGAVWVDFFVESDGSLGEIAITKPLHKLLDQEVVRVVKSMPAWKPSMARVKYTMPFYLRWTDSAHNMSKLDKMPQPKYNLSVYLTASLYMGPAGKSQIQFIVNEDGSISDVFAIKSANPKLDKDVIRVISQMPNWEPGTLNGKPVKAFYTMPINYTGIVK